MTTVCSRWCSSCLCWWKQHKQAIKNPQAIWINNTKYDGSSEVFINVSDINYSQITEEFDNIDSRLSSKSPVGHTHTESEITGLDKYTKVETDNKIDVLLTKITELESTITGLESTINDLNDRISVFEDGTN